MMGHASTPTALVTGASSGIGRATVQRLSAGGWQVFATVRRPEDAQELSPMAGVTPLM